LFLVKVFLQPTVTPCGHTFCQFCIQKSIKENHNCPKCRKSIQINSSCPEKHIEMDNFITKVYEILGGNYLDNRLQLQQKRTEEVRTTNVPGSQSQKPSANTQEVRTSEALEKQSNGFSASSKDVSSSGPCKEQLRTANGKQEGSPEVGACGEQVSKTSTRTKASVTTPTASVSLDFRIRNWGVFSWKHYVPGGQRQNPTADSSTSSTSPTPTNSLIAGIAKRLFVWIGMLFALILLGLIAYGSYSAWIVSYRLGWQGFNETIYDEF
jgi:hypothetical protein